MLSRAKPAISAAPPPASTSTVDKKRKVPKLEHFISARDYTGAITILEFSKAIGKFDYDTQLWLGYTNFHLGDYRKAMELYQNMLQDHNCDPLINLYLACCYFFLGMYKEADEAAQRGPTCKLQNRLLFHLSHKFKDEKRLMGYHQNLQDVIEDQLSLASIHYLRSHYQEAIDIYKRILLENREFLAINVYVAMCYYKLDYYDVSQEVLAVYLQHYPDSLIAINLKACNHFRLYNGKAAEAELNTISEKMSAAFRFADDLIKHNMVVFRGGEGALQAFPGLLDVIPEARLNLVIFHLRNDDIIAAFNLMKDVEPSTPQEYILKGIVNAALGQDQESRDHLKIAQQYFQLVGGSASECDTIPGRQCMASCFFLLKQFDDVLIYLNSIKGYFYNDDTFNYNHGQAKVAAGAYVEAEDILLMIQSEKFKGEYAYLSHLSKCYIMNKKPRLAWELYLKMETSSESFSLLQLIANDCYKMGQYLYSAKAFDVLERLDPNPDYWEGKRGACIGVLQQIISGEESKDNLREIITLLRNTSNPQVEYIVRIIKKASFNRFVGFSASVLAEPCFCFGSGAVGTETAEEKHPPNPRPFPVHRHHRARIMAEEDLEAEFLARERELLGDDALLFGNPLVAAPSAAAAPTAAFSADPLPVASAVPASSLFDPEPSSPFTPQPVLFAAPAANGAAPGSYDFDAGIQTSNAIMASMTQSFPPVSSNGIDGYGGPVEVEPESVRAWRENFEMTIADRDARSTAKNDDTARAAKESLERFYAEYNDKKNKTIARNKENEKIEASREDALAGTIWERVVRLIDTSASGGAAGSKLKEKIKVGDIGKDDKVKKQAPNTKDTTRMKSLLINLKSDKNAPGANEI
ncbi:Intraflagellar transport protein 56 [Entophlyctis sp. JEL0112]|nr:Intraflagellar transport protein 56 [Entophlyctis sp. JEL0112]